MWPLSVNPEQCAAKAIANYTATPEPSTGVAGVAAAAVVRAPENAADRQGEVLC